MEQQLQALKVENAAQAKAQEEATLKMLTGMVEKIKSKRGEMKMDHKLMKAEMDNIKAALQPGFDAAIQKKMDEMMALALQRGGLPGDDEMAVRPRDTSKDR